MDTITITFEADSNGEGFHYNIYTCNAEGIIDGADSIDGGQCTTTLRNALEMAFEQAKEVLKANNE